MQRLVNLCVSILFFISPIFGELIFTPEECLVMDRAFRCLLKDTMCGYAFYDAKPMAIHPYSLIDHMVDQLDYHQTSVALGLAKNIFDNSYFRNQNIIISYDEADNFVLVINKKLFLQTVNNNISLFQYALGPKVEPETLLTAILNDGFSKVLKNDDCLLGILFGYGVKNSLYVSRIEALDTISLLYDDTPPFCNESIIDKGSVAALYYSADGFLQNKDSTSRCYKPSFGFTSLQEEYDALSSDVEVSSEKLFSCKPEFIFGYVRKEKDNLKQIQRLENVQDKINADLSSDNLLSDLLYKISGSKVELTHSLPRKIEIDQDFDYNKLIAKFLFLNFKNMGFDPCYYDSYIRGVKEAISCEESSFTYPEGLPDAIKNLKFAREHLKSSNSFFSELSANGKVFAIVPNYLYFQTIKEGSAEHLDLQTSVVLDYEIYDRNGHLLSYENSISIDLEKTIAGFAHGLKGMHVGEVRKIYIHPAVGYGIHSSTEKGSWIEAIVTLHKISETKELLPQEVKINDLNFILSDKFFQEAEKKHRVIIRDHGIRAGKFVSKLPKVEFDSVVDALNSSSEPLSDIEQELLTKIFWNYYFSEKSH